MSKLIEIRCKICKSLFKDYEYRKRKFCSTLCYSKSLLNTKQTKSTIEKRVSKTKGLKRTQETKDKIGRANKGRKMSVLFRNMITERNRNRKVSLETKRKMSLSHIGELSHLWKGGITSINYLERKNTKYYDWRRSVFERDNYTCNICKEKGNKLVAHHLESFAINKELRTDMNNGITLCKQCHNEFHKICGKITTKTDYSKYIIKLEEEQE